MTTANIVCGSCGAPLSRNDNFCPKCGSRLSWSGTEESVSRRCEVCGHLNPGGAAHCESCGARLAGVAKPSAGASQVPSRSGDRQAPQKEQRRQPAGGSTRKFEPWQIISFVALLVLIAFLVYNEAGKQPSKPVAGSATTMPSQMPGGQSLQDIEPFQRAVEANPSDQEAQLRLANVLHDNGAYLRAIDVYKKYLALRPKDPDARVDMGICYYELSSVDTSNGVRYLMMALAEMERAHSDSPKHQPAVFNLGVVNLRLGNLEESNRWFKEAVQMNRTSDLGVRAQRMLEQHSLPKQ